MLCFGWCGTLTLFVLLIGVCVSGVGCLEAAMVICLDSVLLIWCAVVGLLGLGFCFDCCGLDGVFFLLFCFRVG